MGFLYINSKGKAWTHHSYSAGNTYDHCPYKYYLQKIMGWKEIEKKACFLFGRALENAIQWHHEHDGEGAVQNFVSAWQQHADNKELTYSRMEKDWPSLYKAGVEMVKLYIINQPLLPIPMGGRSLFQKSVEKEVFEGDPTYGGIFDAGKLDILAYVDPAHPMLPQLKWKPEYGPYRPLIVDIKTSGVDFSEIYGIAAHDVQLRRYSWQAGIRDVALLTLVKKSHKIQKGSNITLLDQVGSFAAGQRAVVAAAPENDQVLLLPNDSWFDEMDRVQGFTESGKVSQTKEAKARRDEWILKMGVRCPLSSITKQKLQFNAGYVSIESANDAGAIAGNQVISIVNSWHRKSYPNTFSIRGMRKDINDPYFRAFVLDDKEFREKNFIKTDEETMDDLFADEGEEDGNED